MKTIDEFRDALDAARAATRTTAIHIETDPLAPVPSSESWWDVPVSEVAQLDSTQQARKTYEAHKAEQRPLLTPVTAGEDVMTASTDLSRLTAGYRARLLGGVVPGGRAPGDLAAVPRRAAARPATCGPSSGRRASCRRTRPSCATSWTSAA